MVACYLKVVPSIAISFCTYEVLFISSPSGLLCSFLTVPTAHAIAPWCGKENELRRWLALFIIVAVSKKGFREELAPLGFVQWFPMQPAPGKERAPLQPP